MVRVCTAALLGVWSLAAGALAAPEAPAAPAPAPAYSPPENSGELLAVDEPMRRFFSTRVNPRKTDSERLTEIVGAIVRPEGLHFSYEADGTYDPREAFRRRRGSCVTFAFLVVAVAREYGLEVQFQEFETFLHWNRFDKFIASVRHTNVRLATASVVYVVDLRPDLAPALVKDDQYVVADKRACAHFYSTAGFFGLVRGDAAGARRLMTLGTECDPKSPIVWANLGNLYLVTGELARARACYEKSMRLDSRGELALVGLVDVLRRQGGPEELKLADKYERRAQALRDRNPYYHYHLAGPAAAGGDWAAAEQHLRKAIRFKADEPIFREQLLTVLRQLGRLDDLRREERKLAKLRAKLSSAALSLP